MRQRRARFIVGGLVLVAWCGWVSGFHRSTKAAEITWVVSLAVVVSTGVSLWRGRSGGRFAWPLGVAGEPWPRPGRGGGRLALVGVAPWLVVIVAGVAWDALGIDTGPHQAHLTISALSQAFRPLNALLALVWMLVGIGYAAARARAPVVAARRAPAHGQDLRTDRSGEKPVWGMAGVASAGSHPLAPALLLPSNRPAGVVFWVGLLVVGALVNLAARHSAGRLATAEEFARFISTSPVANIVLMAAWAFAGYHLFAR